MYESTRIVGHVNGARILGLETKQQVRYERRGGGEQMVKNYSPKRVKSRVNSDEGRVTNSGLGTLYMQIHP